MLKIVVRNKTRTPIWPKKFFPKSDHTRPLASSTTRLQTNNSNNDKNANNQRVNRRNLIIGGSIISTILGVLFARPFWNSSRDPSEQDDEKKKTKNKKLISDHASLSPSDELELNLANRGPAYIERTNLESLITFPRFQTALISMRLFSKKPTRDNRQRVLDELAKLSDIETVASSQITATSPVNLNRSSDSDFETAARRIDELIRMRLKKKSTSSSSSSSVSSSQNTFLNDGLASYVSQLLCGSEDLMIELALKVPGVDPRFFRHEPPSTVEKLERYVLFSLYFSFSLFNFKTFYKKTKIFFEFITEKKIEEKIKFIF